MPWQAGKGSATLSMAYAAAVFAESCLKAMSGEAGVHDYAFVASSLTELPYFASRVRLGKEGIEEVLPLGELNAAEAAGLEVCPKRYRGRRIGLSPNPCRSHGAGLRAARGRRFPTERRRAEMTPCVLNPLIPSYCRHITGPVSAAGAILSVRPAAVFAAVSSVHECGGEAMPWGA